MTDEHKARLQTRRPLTKEEYDARQSVIRRVLDPETGRTRYSTSDASLTYLYFGFPALISKYQRSSFTRSSHRVIRGEGEILEEIVSKERHKDINKVCFVLTLS